MEIKESNPHQTTECPQQKLKFLSYIDGLQTTFPLLPLTPQRNIKKWIVDPWDNQNQPRYSSPQPTNYVDQMVKKYEHKAFRLRKPEVHSEKIDKREIGTPLRQSKESSQEKENRPKSRLYSIARPSVKIESKQIEKGPYKVAIQSFIYPVMKEQSQRMKQKMRRMERFHSFVARTIRK